MKRFCPYSCIAAWSLAFFLQGIGLFSLLFPDFLPGVRVPFLSVLVVAVHLPLILRKPRRDGRGRVVVALATVMVVIFAFSLWISRGEAYGLWKLGVFFCMSFVPVVLLCRCYMGMIDRIRHLLRALMLFSFVAVFQLVQAVRGYGLDTFKWHLLKNGTDVIGLSRALGLGAVLALGYTVRNQGVWRKSLMAGTAILMVVGQVLVNERGPLVACMAGMVYLSLANLRPNLVRRDVARLTVTILVFAFLTFLAWRLPSLSDRFTVDALSGDGRIDIYRKGLEDAGHMNMFFGQGFGNFSYYGGAQGAVRQFAHNIFAEIFLETGLVGLMVFVLFVCAIFRYAFNRLATVHAHAAPFQVDTQALFIWAILNAQVSGDVGTNYMVWVAGGLAICAVVASGSNRYHSGCCMVMPEASGVTRIQGRQNCSAESRTRDNGACLCRRSAD